MPKITLPTVLITGCSNPTGIGHSLALTFANQNYHVFATARHLSSLSSLPSIPNITPLELDVTSPYSIQKAFETVSALTGGKLDILYHNAGKRSIAMSLHSDMEMVRGMLGVNFAAVVEVTRVFLPLLINTVSVGKASPKIVFSNSVAAVAPIPSQAVYDASKAALGAYARVLRLEVEGLGIKVVDVVTGEVGTGMAEQAMEKMPLGMCTSEEKGRYSFLPYGFLSFSDIF
jgi:1-acylglycerone phosphate reductase